MHLLCTGALKGGCGACSRSLFTSLFLGTSTALNYKFNMVKKIIQVKDSIPWVRCASGNVLHSEVHCKLSRTATIKDKIYAITTSLITCNSLRAASVTSILSRDSPPEGGGGWRKFWDSTLSRGWMFWCVARGCFGPLFSHEFLGRKTNKWWEFYASTFCQDDYPRWRVSACWAGWWWWLFSTVVALVAWERAEKSHNSHCRISSPRQPVQFQPVSHPSCFSSKLARCFVCLFHLYVSSSQSHPVSMFMGF